MQLICMYIAHAISSVNNNVFIIYPVLHVYIYIYIYIYSLVTIPVQRCGQVDRLFTGSV